MKTRYDDELKHFDDAMDWKGKQRLKKKIFQTIDRRPSRLTRLKYPLSIAALVLIFAVSFIYLMDNDAPLEQATDQGTEQQLPEQATEQGTEQPIDQGTEQPPEQEIFALATVERDTVTRQVEGMEEEFSVIRYMIDPYKIHFQLDEVFSNPEVTESAIIFSYEEDYEIKLEILEETTLDEAIASLQSERANMEESFPLEQTSPEENEFPGYMQYFGYPVHGFFAYEVSEHVLAITFHYPDEAGDGMEPLLADLRKSLHIE